MGHTAGDVWDLPALDHCQPPRDWRPSHRARRSGLASVRALADQDAEREARRPVMGRQGPTGDLAPHRMPGDD
jgi:hypothetical protein